MAGRSESNAVGNSKYTDLNMTFYPTQIDSKVSGNAGYNQNLAGFWNVNDPNLPAGQDGNYVMAEHVNALADAVMAIQRILGINPHIDYKGGNTSGTVSTRIAAAENKDAYYDKRYGGQNWTTGLGQTILTHTHGGGTNEAPQIDLVEDVKGILKKANMDISQSTGITGADLVMSSTVSTKIVDAINDKLSTSQGGTIKKDLTVEGKFSNRTYREWTAAGITSGSQITDVRTLDNTARRFTGTTEQYIIAEPIKNVLMGKYVLGVRAKISNNTLTEAVMRLGFYEWNNSTSTWTAKTVKYISGTDFEANDKWQMFYIVFDHESIDSTGHNGIRVAKDATATSVNLDFDCAWVMPVHPAVFDK
jgi:hypothetical protein